MDYIEQLFKNKNNSAFYFEKTTKISLGKDIQILKYNDNNK